MAVKVNLKKYLAIDGKWQFAPVLKLDGRPQPAVVLISGEPTKGTTGTFYIEWREHGKRIQQPVGTTPREAKDAWQAKVAELDGDAPASEETATLPIEHLSIKEACDNYLTGVQATKAPSTYDAYSADMEWFQRHITRSRVAHVTRTDILRLLAAGREQGLGQASINRRVMVGLMALRDAGATVLLKKRDWPKIEETRSRPTHPKKSPHSLKNARTTSGSYFRPTSLPGSATVKSPHSHGTRSIGSSEHSA